METKQQKSFKNFLIIWFGQFISIIGSSISSFGLSVWVLNKTQQATPFAITMLCQILPGIIFAPISGSLADRKNRKFIVMISDSLDALLKIGIIILLLNNSLEVWMIYVVNFISASLGAFQGPAFNAMIPSIVPKEQLGRANGLRQLTGALKGVLTPVIAGVLYAKINLQGLFIVDLISFAFAITTIAISKIPQEITAKKEANFIETLKSDFKFSIDYIKSKTGLIELILLMALLNALANFCLTLLGPLVMSDYDSQIYGFVNSASGLGMVIGGIAAGALPSFSNKVKPILISLVLAGVGLIVTGFSPLWQIMAIGIFLFMLPVPFANGNFGTIMQTKIESTALGRV